VSNLGVKHVIRTYKILSLLLRYPDDYLKKLCAEGECSRVLSIDGLLGGSVLSDLEALFLYISNTDLLVLQESYVSLFDRQQAFSLYLFEHVHGDSRDRGQALVDLSNVYKASNLDSTTNELPDYIPLFLEYISLLSLNEASIFLSEPINILAILGRRLKCYGSLYHSIFFALEFLSAVKPDESVVQDAVINVRGLKITTVSDSTDMTWGEEPVFVNN
jgi:nitrate reductase delta subunit